jgi:hypothetical protein
LLQGASNREISRTLSISLDTVKTHFSESFGSSVSHREHKRWQRFAIFVAARETRTPARARAIVGHALGL